MTIGDQARKQVDKEIERAAVAGVFDLADVLELIKDRLDERALAEQEPVGELEELLAHVFAQFGDEAQPLGEQEALGERRRDLTFVAKEFAEDAPCQAGHRASVVSIAGSEAKREQFATIIDHEMEFEAIEPAD